MPSTGLPACEKTFASTREKLFWLVARKKGTSHSVGDVARWRAYCYRFGSQFHSWKCFCTARGINTITQTGRSVLKRKEILLSRRHDFCDLLMIRENRIALSAHAKTFSPRYEPRDLERRATSLISWRLCKRGVRNVTSNHAATRHIVRTSEQTRKSD